MRSTRFWKKSFVVALVAALVCAPLASTSFAQSKPLQNQLARPRGPLALDRIKTTASAEGVLIEWRTDFEVDNLGFNVYRERNGHRDRINPNLIAGSALSAGPGTPLNGGYSYSWFDPAGTLDSRYSVEDLNLSGQVSLHQAATPEWNANLRGPGQSKSGGAVTAPEAVAQTTWATGTTTTQPLTSTPVTTESSLTDQWDLATQPALKIGVRTTGWYHITQAQMAAAGFNTSLDAANLRLLVNASEVAIKVSRSSGPLTGGDYIEFWGQGLDLTNTNIQMYWLINGGQAGKRIAPVTELKPDATPTPLPSPPPQPLPQSTVNPEPDVSPISNRPWLGGFFPQLGGEITYKSQSPAAGENNVSQIASPVIDNQLPGGDELTTNEPPVSGNSRRESPTVDTGSAKPKPETPNSKAVPSNPKVETSNSKALSTASRLANRVRVARTNAKLETRNPKLTKSRHRRKSKLQRPKRNHAALDTATAAAPAILYTVERRDRTLYVASVLNGETENFYGDVISPINPDPLSNCNHSLPAQTITVSNIETTALVPATVEVAMQGIGSAFHQIRVSLNGVQLGTMSFFGFERMVQTFTVPLASLNEGTNSIQVVPVLSCPGTDLTLVDYARITYPHRMFAENNSLQFSAKSTQSPKVDGFTVANIRVLDVTNPAAVQEIRPIVESTGAGFAATVPGGGPGKARTLIALRDNTFPTPASITLNQASTLNASNNGASLVIISYKDFIPSLNAPLGPAGASLVVQRQNQGYLVKVVDVEDIYDEFSYGRHDPQAIKDFLFWATTPSHWTTAPQYVMFMGSSSYDPCAHEPRNQTATHADFVPTKLVDATYNETASDDWFVDFNNDGFGELAVGRVPVRTVAAANVVISKILSFVPATVPQSALLVSDDPGTPPVWDFESSNDIVQGLLQPAGITSQKVYRRLAVKTLNGTIDANSSSNVVTGTGTLFFSELNVGRALFRSTGGEPLGTITSISSNTSLTLSTNSIATYSGGYGKQDDATAHSNIVAAFNSGKAIVNYSGHGNIDVWTGANLFLSNDALALTNGTDKLSFVVVMDCLNGLFQDPNLVSLSEAFLVAPNGGGVSAFASSGLTTTFGQRQLEVKLYQTIYGGGSIALGDAARIAKTASDDIDVRRTWIYFGDPTLKIR